MAISSKVFFSRAFLLPGLILQLKTNLNEELVKMVHEGVTVVADWSLTGGMCHSAGCETILDMATNYTDTNFSVSQQTAQN